MNLTLADKVWNRAALEAAVNSPRPGDRALASLLLLHGLVMNGGVQHALECLTPEEISAAIAGYIYIGFNEVAEFLRGCADDPILSTWDDMTEIAANNRYAQLVPDDSSLVANFEDLYHARPEEFAPLGHE